MAKIFGEYCLNDNLDVPTIYISSDNELFELSTLKFNKFKSYDEYKQISNDTLSNEFYLVEDENINAFDNRIINVNDPINNTDAANKQYVDAHWNGLLSSLNVTEEDDIEALRNTLSAIVTIFGGNKII